MVSLKVFFRKLKLVAYAAVLHKIAKVYISAKVDVNFTFSIRRYFLKYLNKVYFIIIGLKNLIQNVFEPCLNLAVPGLKTNKNP